MKHRTLPRAALLALLASLCACSSSELAAPPGSLPPVATAQTTAPVILPLDCTPQLRPAWCWAASTVEVLRTLIGPEAPDVCSVVSDFQAFDCCGDPDPCTFATGNASVAMLALAAQGVDALLVPNLSFDQVRDEIDAGRPFLVNYTDSFPGHIVVIYGYDAETGDVYLCDPCFGIGVLPFNSYFTYRGQTFSWSSTILVR